MVTNYDNIWEYKTMVTTNKVRCINNLTRLRCSLYALTRVIGFIIVKNIQISTIQTVSNCGRIFNFMDTVEKKR